MPDADAALAGRVTRPLLEDVLALVPDEWLEPTQWLPDPYAVRTAYVEHLTARLGAPEAWLGGER